MMVRAEKRIFQNERPISATALPTESRKRPLPWNTE